MRISIRTGLFPRLLMAGAALWLAPGVSLAQRTSVARDFPLYDNGGKPDLAMDPQRFVAQMEIVDRYFAPDDCAIAEGVVGDSGYRRLLRFDTVVMNRGDGDLVVGDRKDPNNPYAPYFVFHPCHGHYHIRNFSIYELLTLDGTQVVAGTKQGFCFEDTFAPCSRGMADSNTREPLDDDGREAASSRRSQAAFRQACNLPHGSASNPTISRSGCSWLVGDAPCRGCSLAVLLSPLSAGSHWGWLSSTPNGPSSAAASRWCRSRSP